MRIRSLFYALLVFALVSCGGKDNPVTPTISVFGVPGEYSVPAEGVSASVNVTASMSWVASSTVSWITVTPTAGKGGSQVPVEITVAENFEQERTGEVVFTVSGTTKSTSIKVNQEAAVGIGADDPPVVVGEQVFLQKFDDGAGLGEFTIVTVERGGFPGDIWTTDSAHPEYGAKAQAYVACGGRLAGSIFISDSPKAVKTDIDGFLPSDDLEPADLFFASDLADPVTASEAASGSLSATAVGCPAPVSKTASRSPASEASAGVPGSKGSLSPVISPSSTVTVRVAYFSASSGL